MQQNISCPERYKIILHLYIKYFSDTTQTYLEKSNGILEESVENVNNSASNFAPTFVNCHLLPDINK